MWIEVSIQLKLFETKDDTKRLYSWKLYEKLLTLYCVALLQTNSSKVLSCPSVSLPSLQLFLQCPSILLLAFILVRHLWRNRPWWILTELWTNGICYLLHLFFAQGVDIIHFVPVLYFFNFYFISKLIIYYLGPDR